LKKNIHPSEKQEAKLEIEAQNKGKVEIGETLVIKPYDLTKNIDKSGHKHSVQMPPFGITGANVIIE